ncbi:hypothetical protein [uncultured Kordia sp.]|uniref:hypothetical protein n=1 Tax=uncultured Kordia sp. TaxID=507699 RepID=UPI00261C4C5D|nr:hypothetical protein [uncultured Kordia sp.]
MKTSKDITKQVESTFDSLENIKEVNVSPFFKDKTMQRLFAEKEEPIATGFGWFTPRLQLATLICVLIMNVIGFLQLNKSEYSTDVSEFATIYGLSQDGQQSLFN